MRIQFIFVIFYISFASSLNISGVNAQILKDNTKLSILKKTVDLIYDFQFENAKAVFDEISISFPGHPVVYLLKGMINYWETYPLLPSSPVRIEYENDLRTCIQLCERPHDETDESEYLLINLCARGLLLLFYSENDLNTEVFPLAKSTYPYIRDSFKVTSSYSDFYFFTGLYNYYREAYPEAHPIYKAVAFLFPKGDMSKGLSELQFAGQYSIFLKAESYSFLSWICANFENDLQRATDYSNTLYELYPGNIYYKAGYIKNLLLLKRYDEAEKFMGSSSPEECNTYYRAQVNIFKGILQEKKYYNQKLAKQYYEKGINDILAFSDYGNEYAAYAYFGLSRIAEYEGDKKRNNSRKMAMELSDFKRDDFSE
jgi:hypothetical protein